MWWRVGGKCKCHQWYGVPPIALNTHIQAYVHMQWYDTKWTIVVVKTKKLYNFFFLTWVSETQHSTLTYIPDTVSCLACLFFVLSHTFEAHLTSPANFSFSGLLKYTAVGMNLGEQRLIRLQAWCWPRAWHSENLKWNMWWWEQGCKGSKRRNNIASYQIKCAAWRGCFMERWGHCVRNRKLKKKILKEKFRPCALSDLHVQCQCSSGTKMKNSVLCLKGVLCMLLVHSKFSQYHICQHYCSWQTNKARKLLRRCFTSLSYIFLH